MFTVLMERDMIRLKNIKRVIMLGIRTKIFQGRLKAVGKHQDYSTVGGQGFCGYVVDIFLPRTKITVCREKRKEDRESAEEAVTVSSIFCEIEAFTEKVDG